MRLLHLEPVAISLEPPLEEPFGLVLFRRDEADRVLVQAGRRALGLDLREEAVFVALARNRAQILVGLGANAAAHGVTDSLEAAAACGAKFAKGETMSASVTAASAVPTA